ncbi:hypothetical protein [Carboxylicivirga taeanensis]|uniref:hypothetical protein n=1 Tax=Carboxylicivirga taeanensis TaxID=1416875 RepID=UPI003F6DFE05
MDSKIIALCGYLLVHCLIGNAQTTVINKDVLIFDDTCSVETDTAKPLTPIVKGHWAGNPSSSKDSSAHRTNTPAISDSTLTVVKGYSPFTNYADTFKVKPAAINKVPSAYKHPNINTQKIIRSKSSPNSLFIHEYDITYTKTSLAQAWYQYMHKPLNQTDYKYEQPSSNDYAQQTASDKQKPDTGAELIASNTSPSGTQITEQKYNNHTSEPSEYTDSNTTIEYYIQLAASREALSPYEIKKLKVDPEQVRIIEEDQWYKYQIAAGENYQQARTTISTYGYRNAFLVAYKGEERLDLWNTVKHIYQQTPKTQELIFVLQLAASRTPLTSQEIAQLHNGHDRVREIKEEGWYKYQITIGSSYRLTIEKWKMIGATRSFPVAYLNGQKIEMSDALKLTRLNK